MNLAFRFLDSSELCGFDSRAWWYRIEAMAQLAYKSALVVLSIFVVACAKSRATVKLPVLMRK